MDSQERLQLAISKAKAGHELGARDLFRDIVRTEPDNKQAWLWLIDLLDDVDQIINACENVLRLDPSDAGVFQHLEALRAEKETRQKALLAEFVNDALRFFADGKIDIGLLRVRDVLESDNDNEKAWGLLAKYSTDLDEQVNALARLSELDPANKNKRALYERWAYYQANPLDLAAFYEERGKWDLAIDVHKRMAATTTDRRDWNRTFNEINRLQSLQIENIAHVSPMLSLVRLTAGMPLLFFFLLVLHVGYDFSYFTLAMGVEFLVVLGGSFLMALSAVGAEHALWRRLGNAAGRATRPLRMAVGMVGFFVMLLPFLLLGFDAFQRWMQGVEFSLF